jgi:hypothetical protein
MLYRLPLPFLPVFEVRLLLGVLFVLGQVLQRKLLRPLVVTVPVSPYHTAHSFLTRLKLKAAHLPGHGRDKFFQLLVVETFSPKESEIFF